MRPAVFDRDVLAFDKSGIIQASSKPIDMCAPEGLGRCRVKKAHHRHRRLLPACCERPRNRRTAEQGAELAAGTHSITSSASASNLSGTVSPSALEVLRLIASSNLVGSCTGRSAGFS